MNVSVLLTTFDREAAPAKTLSMSIGKINAIYHPLCQLYLSLFDSKVYNLLDSIINYTDVIKNMTEP